MTQNQKQGRVIVISSVSGGGKTTLINMLKERYPEFRSAVTATSRSPRTGETHGIDYCFYTKDEFIKKINENEFAEHALVHGNYYGVPAAPLKDAVRDGKVMILNIDVQGMRSICNMLNEGVVTIFLMPPDRDTWQKRLRGRNTDDESAIQKRIDDGESEMNHASEFDIVIVNDHLDRALNELIAFLKRSGVIV